MRVKTFHGVGQIPAERFESDRVLGSRSVGDDIWTVYANVPAQAPELEVYDVDTGRVIRRYSPGCQIAETLRHAGSLRVRSRRDSSLW